MHLCRFHEGLAENYIETLTDTHKLHTMEKHSMRWVLKCLFACDWPTAGRVMAHECLMSVWIWAAESYITNRTKPVCLKLHEWTLLMIVDQLHTWGNFTKHHKCSVQCNMKSATTWRPSYWPSPSYTIMCTLVGYIWHAVCSTITCSKAALRTHLRKSSPAQCWSSCASECICIYADCMKAWLKTRNNDRHPQIAYHGKALHALSSKMFVCMWLTNSWQSYGPCTAKLFSLFHGGFLVWNCLIPACNCTVITDSGLYYTTHHTLVSNATVLVRTGVAIYVSLSAVCKGK